MAFDPVTLLTMSILVLFAVGGLMIQASRGQHDQAALRWSGSAALCLGLGFLLLLAAPVDINAPTRIVGNALFMLPYGFLWAAARSFNRRRVQFEIVLAGVLIWLVLVSVSDPSQACRIAVTSALVAAYSAATAWEHRTGATAPLPAQRLASGIFAGHGAFFLFRALLGPSFGLAAWGPNVASTWGAVLGIETVLVTILIGVASIVMNRERNAEIHRRDALEDPLTGIGNRRALFRSGGLVLDTMRRSGWPTAVLLMDLDRFKAVNDLHGHRAGDDLLVAFARLAHDYLPPTSLVCRIGGEEFAALLPGAGAERARAVADEIRGLFAHLTIAGPQGPVRTTVSIGIAVDDAAMAAEAEIETGQDDSAHRLSSLLARADRCLYAAKDRGRNQVVVESAAPSSPRAAA